VECSSWGEGPEGIPGWGLGVMSWCGSSVVEGVHCHVIVQKGQVWAMLWSLC